MSEEGRQATVLSSFLAANEARLPPSYRSKERLGAAVLHRCASEVGGEFDTESADTARLGPMDELSVREDEILMDRDVAALMDTDDSSLQELLDSLEREADRVFNSDSFIHWAAQRPETVSFVHSNNNCVMTEQSIRESAGAICMKMYGHTKTQNALEKDLVRMLDQNIAEIQSTGSQLTPEQTNDIIGNIRQSLMHVKMCLDDRRKQSTSKREYKARKAEKKEKYLAMSPEEQEVHTSELRQRIAHYLAAGANV